MILEVRAQINAVTNKASLPTVLLPVYVRCLRVDIAVRIGQRQENKIDFIKNRSVVFAVFNKLVNKVKCSHWSKPFSIDKILDFTSIF